MAKECWQNCPRVCAEISTAAQVTEYMPPGQTVDNIWTRHSGQAQSLSQDCPGPTFVKSETSEERLPLYFARKFFGITATEQLVTPVYDCTMQPAISTLEEA